ncbi:hypothetical protein [Pseudomonas sp. Marseille-P9899]|uniref:hypothetical protein n=1 Tax=Pseudomonas sp. Marseille-P9899 TaxID=2730401 RepID=UPI00158A25B8|nr:hypothetical protein [Pseudomonas sp. Marseille-P9899]
MSRFLLHLCGALALCLSIGLGPLHAQTLSGPQLAAQLNQAYASTPVQCVGGYPAYFCSGVMAKQVLPSDPQPFWTHGPDAVARGSERFDYLRRDIANTGLVQDNGYLFADRYTAIGQNKDYQLVGDDGMNRPPELLVRNWAETAPAQLPIQALYHRRTTEGLRAALRDQHAYFTATGIWLPVLRMATAADQGQSFGFDASEQLYSGYQVADRLNRRYADTASTCYDGRSAIHCNGVFIRGTGYGAGFHAWNPSPNSVARDGVSFAWVRADNGVQVVVSPGLIFHELGKPSAHSVRFRCAYPANAGTSGIADSCRASCTSQNISTVASWQAAYGPSPGASCTFGDTPAEIQLNTDVRKGQTWASGHTELIIGAWPQDIPAELPIEAFFYLESSSLLAAGRHAREGYSDGFTYIGPAGLTGAQYIQNDYFQVTGRFKPIVRVDLTAPLGSRFLYYPQDQGF